MTETRERRLIPADTLAVLLEHMSAAERAARLEEYMAGDCRGLRAAIESSVPAWRQWFGL